ncbi:MAG: hypothetical protein OEN00_06840, partial [Gemmatimonadota bacterium]|nr:hypothetical protein [Gemmatimonadota bacterium]
MIAEIALSVGLAVLPQHDTVRLSLDDAVRRARDDNPALLAHRAAARARAQAPLEASRAFLPNLQL